MNEINSSNHSRPETPSSPSLTLQRANQVVNYLDNVLDDSIREMDGASGDNPQEQLQTSQNNGEGESTETTGHESETTTADPAENEPTSPEVDAVHSRNSVLSEGRNSTTTATSTRSSSSSGDSGSSTSTNSSDASNRNSSTSQSSGDTSHIVADTHL